MEDWLKQWKKENLEFARAEHERRKQEQDQVVTAIRSFAHRHDLSFTEAALVGILHHVHTIRANIDDREVLIPYI